MHAVEAKCSIHSTALRLPTTKVYQPVQPCVLDFLTSSSGLFVLPLNFAYQMAEVFGMAAGVAGMASLAIQLMESSRKLHALYHTSKDAPDTVNQLSFELTTLSKHILQLERMRHRPDGSCDTDCDEMLSRCLYTCAMMSAKIKIAVDKVDCALQKSRFAGSLYMAFKEAEIRKLLEEMEQAKTSMILAHLQYIE